MAVTVALMTELAITITVAVELIGNEKKEKKEELRK